MNSLFHYDSKFMQILQTIADYILLNVLYVLCCLPIFTIGAAQAGLYNGLRVLQDKEDDRSCLKAFFRGFRTGFGTITAVWVITALILAVLCYCTMAVWGFSQNDAPGGSLSLAVSIIAVAITAVYLTILPLFHARFACTAKQLLQNSFLVAMANPLQTLLAALILWAPVLLFLFHFPLFLQTGLLLVFLYYSVTMGLTVRLFSKAFRRLEEANQ